MTSETPLQLFIDLIEFDQSLVKREKQIETLKKEFTSIKNQQMKLQHELEAAKMAFHQTKQEVDSCELEMKQLDQKIAQKKERLEQVTNHREYQSIKAEIDMVRREQHALEEQLVVAWQNFETAQKQFDAKKSAIEQQEHSLGEQNKQKIMASEQLQSEINQLTPQRQEKEKLVPAEWLEKYAIMRAKVIDPVVPAINGICSACSYLISEQDMSQLRKRKLVQCKDCFRLLYADLPASV